ncbi:MAG: ABC transporter permease [Myxococcota bacterium]
MFRGSLPTLAWRNLIRHRRRTAITLSSIAFGILLSVIFTGMGDSTYAKMIDLAARMGSGHVTIQHPDYQDTPSLKKTVHGVDELREVALADPQVERVVTRITGPVMLATAANSSGAFFMGIDPQTEDVDTLAGFDSIAKGQFFDKAKGKGIILGKTLAENLDVRLGKKVVYTVTDINGEIVSGLAKVRAIVDTGTPGLDATLCWLPFRTAAKALGYDDDVATQVAVYAKDARKSAELAKRLGQAVPEGAAVLTWKQTQPELAGFITVDRSGAIVFETIILIVIAAGIFNSLYVSVVQRTREFGIMMAVGYTPLRLFVLVMWESLWLALLGLISGALVTVGPYLYLNANGLDLSEMMGEGGSEVSGITFDPVIYPDIYPDHLALIAVVVVVTTLLSGLLPAWRAGQGEPVESIRVG